MDIILFIVVLVGLIVVHEFGHFIVAKRAGVRVDEFGIFFGPTLLRTRIGETDYTLNLIPIGGFVRIFGENSEDVPVDHPDRGRALFSKSKPVRAAVLVAGVTFNALLAWMLISGALMIGVPASVEESPGQVRGAALTVTSVLNDTPASRSGLAPGDVIVRVTAQDATLAVPTAPQLSEFIAAREGETLTVVVERGGEAASFEVIPAQSVIDGELSRAAIGISMGEIGRLVLPPHRALVEGFVRTVEMLSAVTVGIVSFLGDALVLSADVSSVAGPVGIVSLVGDAASLGIVSLLMFAAIISVHLAIINLLPIPALDGGRLLFVLIEAVKGSPIRPSVAAAVNTAGFALLIALMIAVTYGDIVRLTS